MNKLGLIIQREYLTRVKKKSFIFATIAVPLGFMLIPLIVMWIATASSQAVIGVVDRSGFFRNQLVATAEFSFEYLDQSLDSAKTGLKEDSRTIEGILYVPPIDLDHPKGIQYYSDKGLSLQSQRSLQFQINRILENQKLLKAGLSEDIFRKIKKTTEIESIMMTDSGERSDSKFMAYAIAYVMGMVMYIAILIYGVMVMNGVVEEKANRIMEVLVSSVRPFELLFGKIIGIGLVGLTQLLIWSVIGAAVMSATAGVAAGSFSASSPAPAAGHDAGQIMVLLKQIEDIDFGGLLAGFMVYFLGGYFLYAALYAAVASAVNDTGDVQSPSLPVTMPVIFAFIVMNVIINDPHGPLAFWCSMIPLTSPIVMMGRIPFGVPWWELLLSAGLLFGGFIAAVWLASKIYRTGILMYGKKPSFKEIFRWLLYKN